MSVDSQISFFDEPTDTADWLGMLVSAVCAVHCLLVPVLFYLLPAAGATLGDERLEWGLLVVAGLVASLSLGLSYRHHRSRSILALLVAGLLLLVAARLLEEYGEPVLLSALVSVAGATALVTGHAFNLRRRHSAVSAATATTAT